MSAAKVKLKCSKCQHVYSHRQHLHRHQLTCLPTSSETPSNSRVYKCNKCSYTSNRKDNLKRHISNPKDCSKKKAKESLKCAGCGKTFSKKANLKRHLKDPNLCKLEMTCLTCGKKYTRSDHFENHLKSHDNVDTQLEDDYEMDNVDTLIDNDYDMELPTMAMESTHSIEGQTLSLLSDDDSSINNDWDLQYDIEASLETTQISTVNDEVTSIHDEYNQSVISNIPQQNVSVDAEEQSANDSRELENNVGMSNIPSQTTSTSRTLYEESPIIRRFRPLQTPTPLTPIISTATTSKSDTSASKTKVPLTPTTRKTKSRIAQRISSTVVNLPQLDQIEVFDLAIRQLKLMDYFKLRKIQVNGGRKLTPLRIRSDAWTFWHDQSTPSTLSTQKAKLRVSDKPKLHSGLSFVDTYSVIQQRNVNFYENLWYTTTLTYRELFKRFCSEFPQSPLSYGTFLGLKPFYVCGVTTKDVEMCCCKRHLHARWMIAALVNISKLLLIPLPFDDYNSFFGYITQHCAPCPTSYISWDCAINKKSVCKEIMTTWFDLKKSLLATSDKTVTVKVQHFVKVEVLSKKTGKVSKKLTPQYEDANMPFIVNFIESILKDMIFHRNQLKHYRSTIKTLRNMIDHSIDVDFSENLKVPVKEEPQSLHWHHEQKTVHSAILKTQGEKTYFTHVSDDKIHDSTFMRIAVNDILVDVPIAENDVLGLESDNCCAQYKKAAHFKDCQDFANRLRALLLRIYGISGHGKGEVDHVGGISKVAIRREVAAGKFLSTAEQMVEFLNDKFFERDHPKYSCHEVTSKILDEERASDRLFRHKTIEGSSTFQVLVFKPDSETFKAAPRICICELCNKEYGSCSLFTEYSLNVQALNKVSLRSNFHEHVEDGIGEEDDDDNEDNNINDFFLPGSICAVAASDDSGDTVWFIEIIDEDLVPSGEPNRVDGYKHVIGPGVPYLRGYLLEKIARAQRRDGDYYKVIKSKETFFYKDTIVYPFVQFDAQKKGLFLSNTELVTILNYVESNSLTPLTNV